MAAARSRRERYTVDLTLHILTVSFLYPSLAKISVDHGCMSYLATPGPGNPIPDSPPSFLAFKKFCTDASALREVHFNMESCCGWFADRPRIIHPLVRKNGDHGLALRSKIASSCLIIFIPLYRISIIPLRNLQTI